MSSKHSHPTREREKDIHGKALRIKDKKNTANNAVISVNRIDPAVHTAYIYVQHIGLIADMDFACIPANYIYMMWIKKFEKNRSQV